MDSNITIVKIDDKNIRLYKVILLQSFHFHPDLERTTRERGLLEEIIKLVQKNKTKLYLLKNSNEILGLIALSASSIDDFPVIQVDYLFVDYKYRKVYVDTMDSTISNYLLLFAMNVAENIKETIGLKYLALYPDAQSEKLISHYKEMGFNVLNKYWLFIKLK
ncbi:MAG: hypothetical protein A3K14_02185 [Sulfurimonas sp. RIFCSPLOWO2_12_FULL_36_74]|uniref:hypothetical protein n=1 Tax=Sulfurimonas sp. RIFCSPLOWO2_12_36_12 TaxID=1802253 RepID=UPI0008C667BA|nr:hypothetical protein [Sulfurimonas sp. RIFCSPLOWO2_12_36_12]OHE00503.1 MAG: hypothetical protein A3J26_07155 [Sulfurimonas sp. RIFCSPLOWO2_02_FULL_36_28]OHE01036.1 MAG: hypothetical protein A2W82_10710 [Sulfurimonas sp. RIFCSPLOWO2_12_36_12]OHE02550.1 MAG: hypothetical protein A3K14_02185 [Sulfurimonas sp. RIFCSPLOWO2_12_FULL_36_74]